MGRGRLCLCYCRWAVCIVGGRLRAGWSSPNISVERPLLSLCGHCHVRFVVAIIGLDWPQIPSCWAVGVGVGVNVSSIGCTFCRRALSVVVGCYMSPTGGVCCQWAVGWGFGDFVGLCGGGLSSCRYLSLSLL